ncbi:hypothetical protein [Streptomyces coelicoflavus]|uniref:hypothetical protein n=1 Tax=Streptomyces coelicoflavus TaxID=285562 RepID=UPI001FD1E32D|nr:hypothetical protein [Streptomyces coelicoflavus]
MGWTGAPEARHGPGVAEAPRSGLVLARMRDDRRRLVASFVTAAMDAAAAT